MATLTVKKTLMVDWSPGWKTVAISGAKKGKYEGGEGKKYIDVFFEGYPETIKLRVHQKFNKTTKEEFNIANVFRYANAGIEEVSKTDDGAEMMVEINIDPVNLVGKKLNVYFYKNAKGYTDISDNVVPGEPFENIVETFKESDLEGLMKYTYTNRIKPYISTFNSDDWDQPSSNGEVSESNEDNEPWEEE